jgi:hypothetical protein
MIVTRRFGSPRSLAIVLEDVAACKHSLQAQLAGGVSNGDHALQSEQCGVVINEDVAGYDGTQ